MGERNGFGQIFIQRKHSCQRAGKLRYFQAMGQAGTVIVAFMFDEYLRLVLQPSKG